MLVDANVFLAVQLDESARSDAAEFLRSLACGDHDAIVTEHYLDAVRYLMDARGASWREIMTFFASLTQYDGLRVVNRHVVTKARACRIMAETELDLDDAIAVRAMRDHDRTRIVSYDEDFDSIDRIDRLTPGSLV